MSVHRRRPFCPRRVKPPVARACAHVMRAHPMRPDRCLGPRPCGRLHALGT
jgi:hypothetical protein